MDLVCDVCGDSGFTSTLLLCRNCKNTARHRYCFDKVIFDPVREWLCNACQPRIPILMELPFVTPASGPQENTVMPEAQPVLEERPNRIRKPSIRLDTKTWEL